MPRTILLLVCALSAACGGSDTTTGRTVRLQTRIEADPEIENAFTTETGWSVRLSQAVLGIGALYYFDGEPAFVRSDHRPLLRRLASWFGVPVARAHPGHYLAGMALGQMTEPASVDLLAGSTDLAEGMGISGLYRSARFVLAAGEGAGLAGKVARVAGVASKGDKRVYFALSAEFSDVTRSVSNGQVEGCQFEETQVEHDGAVTVRVEPHVWFNLVDFSDVEPGSADAPTQIVSDDTPQVAFALGLVQLSAYHFSYAR